MPALEMQMSTPPNFQALSRKPRDHRVFPRHIDPGSWRRRRRRTASCSSASALGEGIAIDVAEHHAGAFVHEPPRGRKADAAGAAGDQRDAAGQGFRLRHALQLGFFEIPVLDVEGFLLGQAAIGGNAGRAAHHVDGVDVELAGDARGGLVRGERDHADAGHQIDHGIGIAHLRRARTLAALVVAGVALAIGLDRGLHARDELLDRLARRIEGQHQRPDLGAQEVIGARSAERREAGELFAADEFEHGFAVVEVTDLVRRARAFRRTCEIKPRIRGMMPAAISRRRSMVSACAVTAPNGRLPRLCSVEPAAWRD